MIIITGQVRLNSEHRDRAIRLGCEHSARSLEEDGCLSHNCYLDAEDENRLHFFERWRDMDAVSKHFAVPESGDFVRALTQLASAPPEISIYTADPVEGPPL